MSDGAFEYTVNMSEHCLSIPWVCIESTVTHDFEPKLAVINNSVRKSEVATFRTGSADDSKSF